ncbi:pyridoxine/pyridoxamine 5'-phosphate oxidase [Kineococcus rhizosphaerae]|uniref:Pyridoxamine 5'-phosphate oxidase n=1 Tax=Kineococcus rhizosphaerae TaxID=559628 RepID=A0A2T0R310_9ACTN|nr:pyridoxamine 5'-phosphate oxidase family protein [Kineococcus rhizosphaerae]PRY14151.1 pyridoxamine 5'-phosphate oxidase [Kineococcus rhizosphaerae]
MPSRETLRALPVFDRELPAFDPSTAPADPLDLFGSWFADALAAGVPEPHAVTLSTVDADGLPDARVLILKDVSADGWSVATTTAGPAGAQLLASPVAALSVYWTALGRQVRVRGHVHEAPPHVSEADFAARSASARARVPAGTWRVFVVRPVSVEFWQAVASREHVRVRYVRAGGGWTRS